jgi:hypothetical protein
MKIQISVAMLLLFALCAFGQTAVIPDPPVVPSITMPTYVAGGVAFNQLGTPRFNAFASAIVPVSSQAGVYESTTADIIPVSKVDPATKRIVYTFSSQIREGVHKTLYTGGKAQVMIGGDVGGSFNSSTASTSGMTVSLAASVTATFVYQFSAHWAVIMPVRGLYTASIGGWNLIPELGLVWKPGSN